MSQTKFTIPFYPIATEKDLARARRDRELRRKLVVSNLQNLIGLMTALRSGPDADDPALAPLLREAADLTMELTDLVKKLPPPKDEG